MAGLRGKLARHVRTIDEQLRERLVMRDLAYELDREEMRGRIAINTALLPHPGLKDLPGTIRRLYDTLRQVRQHAELDPYAFSASPQQLYVQANMAKLFTALEEANLMQYEEPSPTVNDDD